MTSYTAEIVKELPALRVVEFDVPGGTGVVGLQVLVRAQEGAAWVGKFRTRQDSDLSGVETWEHGPYMLVVAGGYAHYVDVRTPSHSVELPVFPVRHMLRHSSGVVVLGDFLRFCGITGNGVQWVSQQVADDWIEDVRIEGDFILGRGSMNAESAWADFKISVQDGRTSTDWRGVV